MMTIFFSIIVINWTLREDFRDKRKFHCNTIASVYLFNINRVNFNRRFYRENIVLRLTDLQNKSCHSGISLNYIQCMVIYPFFCIFLVYLNCTSAIANCIKFFLLLFLWMQGFQGKKTVYLKKSHPTIKTTLSVRLDLKNHCPLESASASAK